MTPSRGHRPEGVVALRPAVVLDALIAVTVVVAVVDRGGYGDGPGSVFVALAGASLLAAAWQDERLTGRALGRPPVLILLALGLFGLLSAAWAIGPTGHVARSALVVVGYAALAAAAAVAATRPGAGRRLAVLVGGLAIVTAAWGLGAVALRTLPAAERIGGAWRPGGPFEYPPALALLQVMALPAVVRGARAPGLATSAVAASGLVLAGAVLGIAGNRFPLVLAALVLLAVLVAGEGALRPPRALDAAAAGVVVLGAVLGVVLLRGSGHDAARVAALVLLVAGAAAAWFFARRLLPPARLTWRATGAVGLAVVVALVVAALATRLGGPGPEPTGGLAHGRTDTWSAALATGADRPLAGAGAGTFYVASAGHQGGSPVRFAHDLPLEGWAELGVPGALLVLGLYATALAAVWRRRAEDLLPATIVVTFLAQNLLDWPWHLAGLGAIFALGLGVVVREGPARGGFSGPERARDRGGRSRERRSPPRRAARPA